MSIYRELDELLSAEMPLPMWADEEQYIARDLVKSFTDRDWLDLESSWQDKDGNWQIRLCEALSGRDGNPRAIGILLELADVPDKQTAVRAVDALRCYTAASLAPYRASLESKVQSLQVEGKIASVICRELLKKIGP